MPEVQFNNFTELYNFIKDNGVEITPVISAFFQKVEDLDRGCNCTRAARVKRVESFYLSLSMSLDLTAQDSIKEKATADIVKMYHNGALFLQF